jgi:hypothetical protein
VPDVPDIEAARAFIHRQQATLPVQPPSGTWQLRLARVYPVFVANIVLFFALALTTHRNSATWVPVWILLACGLVQCVFLIVVGIRATQLERRERKLGYTTWARKH